MSHRVAALTLAAVALLGLTACTSPASVTPDSRSSDAPGDAGQSTADACALVQQGIEDATAQFDNAASADPQSVVDAMKTAAQTLADTAAQVTNDEVAAVLPSLQDMFTEASEVMEAIVKGDASKFDDLSQLGTKFTETSEAFQAICEP